MVHSFLPQEESMDEVQLDAMTEENLTTIQAVLERTTKENELLREDNQDMSLQIETYIAKISELQSLVLCRPSPPPPPPPPPPPKPEEKDEVAMEEIQRINDDLLHQVRTLVQEKCDLQTKIEELEHEISTRVEKPYPMPARLSTEILPLSTSNRWIKGLLTARSPGGASVVTVSSDSQPTTTSEMSFDSILPNNVTSSSPEEGYFVSVPNQIEPESNVINDIDSPTLPVASSSQFCATIEEEDDLERVENGESTFQEEENTSKQPGLWSFQGLLASSRSVGAANTFARFVSKETTVEESSPLGRTHHEECESTQTPEQSLETPGNASEPACEVPEPSSSPIDGAMPQSDSTSRSIPHASPVPVSPASSDDSVVFNDHNVSESVVTNIVEHDVHDVTENVPTAPVIVTTDASTQTIPEEEVQKSLALSYHVPQRPQGLTIASLLMEQPWERDDVNFAYHEVKMLPRKVPSL